MMSAAKTTNASTPTERLHRIVREGVCIGCGLCEAVAGPDRVRVQKAQNGYERPVVVGFLDHETVDRIYDLCPATRWDGLPERLVETDTQIDPYWGPYRAMVLAHASDQTIRIKAATGGVLTALAMYMIEAGMVEFVLHASPSKVDATFGKERVSIDAADVARGSGSIYGPTAPLRTINTLLDRNEPFGFVGKPCDIAALRNLAQFDERVNRLVKIWMTPVCGGFVPPPEMDSFLAGKGVSRDDLKSFRYRGDGCPGRVEYELRDGSTGSAHMYEPYGGLEEENWQLPFRCKICPDGPGEGADIAAGDQWEDAKPDPVLELTDPGTNAVIIRTRAGEELFRDAEAAGYITIERQITPRWYDNRQPHQVAKKLATRARWDGLAAEGHLVPRSQGLRLDALSKEAGPESYQYEMQGARKRVESDVFREPIPVPVDQSSS